MTFACACVLLALVFLNGKRWADESNPNGVSVSILQRMLIVAQRFAVSHPVLSAPFFLSPRLRIDADLNTRQWGIERLVWFRLLFVGALAIATDLPRCLGIVPLIEPLLRPFRPFLAPVLIAYIAALQATLLVALLRPLFGAVLTSTSPLGLDVEKSSRLTPDIPAPRRSLLMALVNFLEIMLSWAFVYRILMPDVITSLDKANYFSVVTLTTLGYGEISAGEELAVQLAVTANMLVFLVFSVCHVTTIVGAMVPGAAAPPSSKGSNER